MKKNLTVKLSVGVASAVFGLLPVLGHAVTTTLPNGAALSVQIDKPLNNEEFNVPPGQASLDVAVEGKASVGEGKPSIGMIVVVDNSGSTSSPGGGCGNILDCEKKAVIEMLKHSASVAEFGVVVFGSNAVTADMTNSAGDQLVTSSSNDAGTVTNSINLDGAGQFTPKDAGGMTNYADALAKATNIATAMSSNVKTKSVIFLSDGGSNQGSGFDAKLAALKEKVDTIYPFAIGADGCSVGSAGTLAAMGNCKHIEPEELQGLLPNLLWTHLKSVDVSVGGNVVPSNKVPSVPADGPLSTEYNATAADLAPGTYNICASANGLDRNGDSSVEECVNIHLLQLTASPASAVNDLNVSTSHIVTANIVGGSGPARNVNFTVSGQNAGSGSVNTLPNNEVQFTYTVPKSCSSLGTDIITVKTEIGGQSVAIPLKKIWIDKTPPTVSCAASVNPAGKNTPKAPGKGGQGQNQDGFYKLTAADSIPGCVVTLNLADEQGFIFPGTFMIGDTIKYTQDDDTPQRQEKMGGKNSGVTWHLIGHGDLVVTASDVSGNQNSIKCLVPKAPK